MRRSDEQWLSIVDEFSEAAIDQSRWYTALEKLAAATGSRSGQLISVGSDAAVPLNLLTNVDPQAQEAFVECGGGDPNINPRVKAGMNAPLLQSLAEHDFLTPEEHATNPHYRDFARPWDVPFICLTTLERRDDLVIGLSVLRSAREGHVNERERAIFNSLAPHVRSAVRMQLALEGKGAELVKGTLETLSSAAFVCGSGGMVQAMTAQADSLVSSNRGLSLRAGRLRALRDDEDKNLTDAIEAAGREVVRPGAPMTKAVLVRGNDPASAPIVLDVMPLPPSALEFSSGPRVVIVARGPRGTDARKATLLQGVYGFTAAEIDVALQLSRGQSTEAIATDRGVAVGTVRAQIKSMLAKLGVSRQLELVARLSEF